MKLVINDDYGGFGLSEYAANKLGVDRYDVKRYDADLIKLIEEEGADIVGDRTATLKVVEIPDTTTDYYINEYDGLETIIYVVDGKLNFA